MKGSASAERAASGKTVELTAEPGSSDVLRFENCSGICLENLVIGHTPEQGSCTGSVLEFNNSRDITLKSLDLYGCGAYGISCIDCTGLEAESCTIRDCSWGIMNINGCYDLSFVNCGFKNNIGYDMLETTASILTFESCSFEGNSGDAGFINTSYSNFVTFRGCSFGVWESGQINDLSGIAGGVVFDENCSFADGVSKNYVAVRTTEELFEAIDFDTVIIVEPGYYNMSEWLEKVWAEEGEAWNVRHPYIRLQECYDGVEAVIHGVSGLTITGRTEDCADTELVIDPRHGDVLTFENSSAVTLAHLTAGHTDRGECSGSVFYLYDCDDFVFADLRLRCQRHKRGNRVRYIRAEQRYSRLQLLPRLRCLRRRQYGILRQPVHWLGRWLRVLRLQ